MTRDDKRNAIQRVVVARLALDAQLHALGDLVGSPIGSPLWDVVEKTFDALLDTTATLIGDTGAPDGHGNWLSWWVWDNDCGQAGLAAGYDGNLRPIKTPDDLLDMIEEAAQ